MHGCARREETQHTQLYEGALSTRPARPPTGMEKATRGSRASAGRWNLARTIFSWTSAWEPHC